MRIKLRFNAAEHKEPWKFPEPGAVTLKLCLGKTGPTVLCGNGDQSLRAAGIPCPNGGCKNIPEEILYVKLENLWAEGLGC